MERKISVKYLCVPTLVVLIVYFLVEKHSSLLQISWRVPFRTLDVFTTKSTLPTVEFNQTNVSNFQMDSPLKPFENRWPVHHPYLPIHMYTNDVRMNNTQRKLILLGNAFFGDRTWSIALSNRSSTDISKS
jgi:hypothetical protein